MQNLSATFYRFAIFQDRVYPVKSFIVRFDWLTLLQSRHKSVNQADRKAGDFCNTDHLLLAQTGALISSDRSSYSYSVLLDIIDTATV